MPLSSRRTTCRNRSGIALLMRRLGAVTLRIGHGAADDDIGGLRPLEESEEALVIVGAVSLASISKVTEWQVPMASSPTQR